MQVKNKCDTNLVSLGKVFRVRGFDVFLSICLPISKKLTNLSTSVLSSWSCTSKGGKRDIPQYFAFCDSGIKADCGLGIILPT